MLYTALGARWLQARCKLAYQACVHRLHRKHCLGSRAGVNLSSSLLSFILKIASIYPQACFRLSSSLLPVILKFASRYPQINLQLSSSLLSFILNLAFIYPQVCFHLSSSLLPVILKYLFKKLRFQSRCPMATRTSTFQWNLQLL